MKQIQKLKQTEIGEIPVDWDIKTLGDIGEFKNGINKSNESFGFGSPFVNLMDVFGRTKIENSSNFGLINSNDVEKRLYNLIKGDIIFIRSSVKPSGVGLTCVITYNLPDTVFSGFLIRFRDKGLLTDSYKQYCFYNERFRNSLISNSTVSANTNINQEALKKLIIVFPKDKVEQSLIASVLSDTDSLIESLDKLIAKKKNIKQGVMQELLTEKKRLPGFNGEWGEINFGTLVEINKGQQLNKSELTLTGEYPDWNGGIEPSGYTHKWNMTENTITISEGGNSCGFVNYCKTKFWLGGHCYALKLVESNLNQIFLYHLLKFKEKSIMGLRIGSGLPNIQKKDLNEFIFKRPQDPKEQSAIAQILSDMDADIETLELKRDKYKEIKTGMMQELLTGRIRLK